MEAPSVLLRAIVSRVLPQAQSDTTDARVRAGRYGELVTQGLWNTQHALADEGAYFVSTNPAPGTGLATIAAPTTLADTSPFILVKNNHKAGGKRLYLDFLKLICTAAGTGGASIHAAVKIDDVNPTRYTSGGSQITPVNVNMDDAGQSGALVYAGALVAAAASAAVRLVDHALLRPVIPVVGDTYYLNFGGAENMVGSLAPAGTAIAQQSFNFPPVVIGPGQWAAIHVWLPSQSAASSYEFALAHVER